MTLPNFLIVGAVKSGTTSLYNYLKQHPDIFMPPDKEPQFFIHWKGGDDERLSGYKALFKGSDGFRARGEASTVYLYDEATPGRIKSLVPDMKIIISLRNPAEMAYSLWRYVSRIGKRGEWLPFKEALEEEPRRMADPDFPSHKQTWPPHFFYYHRGLYYGQVKRYMDTLGRDNVKVILFDDLKADPLKVCRELYGFLGVDADFVPDLKKHNVGNVRHRGLNKLIMEPTPAQLRLAGLLPDGLSSRLKDFIVRLNSKPAPPMDPEMKKELTARFRPDVEKLSVLINRDLSKWL